MSTSYDVLEVASTATQEEIKASYQRLILLFHPDKSRDASSAERFIAIQEAWKNLDSEEHREAYDQLLAARSAPVVNSERVPLSDFERREDDTNVRSKACRCGEYYEITDEDLQAGFNTVQCNGCSLYVTVLLDDDV